MAEILNESKADVEIGHEVEQTKTYLRTPLYEKFHSWLWVESKKWEGENAELKLAGSVSEIEGTSTMSLTSGEKFGLFT